MDATGRESNVKSAGAMRGVSRAFTFCILDRMFAANSQ
jgi:hypothetical protein